MRHESVSKLERKNVDWKGLGYLVSMASVLLLGAVAWPKPGSPDWEVPVLIAGMATSILGMGFRYLSHRQQQMELEKTKADARKRR